MFTGIVEELGEVVILDRHRDRVRLSVRAATVTADATLGDSIAVNGVCLTVADTGGGVFTADVMPETLARSSLADLVPGAPVNLERALRLDGRLGGHLVQGHVDGTASIVERVPGEHWEVLRITLARELGRYVVPKGSVAVDGVSLTVTEVTEDSFAVSLIPTTLGLTTLGSKQVGERVNVEVDVLAKYVEKLLSRGNVA